MHSYELVRYTYTYNGELNREETYTNSFQLDSYDNLLHSERTCIQTNETHKCDVEYYD